MSPRLGDPELMIRVELILNLKTAKALGLTIPLSLLGLERGAIPAVKVGNRWVANRDALRKHFGVRPEGSSQGDPP